VYVCWILFIGRWLFYDCRFGGFMCLCCIILVFYIFDFGWLVGAFCDFGDADTGKPVQILSYFRKSVLNLELLGLI